MVLLGAGTAAATRVESSAGQADSGLRGGTRVASTAEEPSPGPETAGAPLAGPIADPVPNDEPATPAATTTSGSPPTTASPAAKSTTPPPPPPPPATQARPTAQPQTKGPLPSPETPRSSYETMWSNLAPDWGEAGTTMTVNGGGCAGRQAGVSVVTKDPGGTFLARHTGFPRADGTWSIPIVWPAHLTTGRYPVEAECVTATSTFAYQLHTFYLNTATRPEDRPPTGPNIPSTG